MKAKWLQLSLLCIFLSSCIDKNMNEYIESSKSDKNCRVYFFERWGSYSHPVKPIGPLTYEEALGRNGFGRAWMCSDDGEDRFVLFETIRVTRKIIENREDGLSKMFYKPVFGKDGVIYPGDPMGAAATLDASAFVYYSREDKGEAILYFVEQNVAFSFEYEYQPSGALNRVIINKDNGETNVLEY